MVDPLVSTQWLAERMALPGLVVLDASLSRSVAADRIVGSRRMDMDGAFCDLGAATFRALPSPEQFVHQARLLGIRKESIVVIYDDRGVYSSPRAWWMFRIMGFERVFVLDGGLPRWLAESRPSEIAAVEPAPSIGDVDEVYQPSLVCDAQEVLEMLQDEDVTIVDVRSEGRFLATLPEPREGVRRGHIPGSINLPFSAVLDGHVFRSVEQLMSLFEARGMSADRQYVFLCGSGVTACIVLVATLLCGFEHVRLYDGSWTEWGGREDLPVC